MDPGEQVDEEIAGNARPVLAIVAPPEETHRLERPLRRAPEESIPIDGLGRGVGRNRVLPRADCRVAVDPGFDEIQLADRTGAKQLARLCVDDRADALTADLEDSARLPAHLDDPARF